MRQSKYSNCCQGKIGVLNWQQSQWADWWIWIDTLTECGLPVLQVGTCGQSTLGEGPGGLEHPNLFFKSNWGPHGSILAEFSHDKRKLGGRKENSASLWCILPCSCQPYLRSKLIGFQTSFVKGVMHIPGGYSGFQVMGMFKQGQKSKPKKSLAIPTKPKKIPGPNLIPPKKSHAKFLSLKIFKKH